MEDYLSKAQRYRDQAGRMQLLAAGATNEEFRKSLIALAENYEHLCQNFLARAGITKPENAGLRRLGCDEGEGRFEAQPGKITEVRQPSATMKKAWANFDKPTER